MIDITGLSKAAVLAALYNASKPQGMGFLQYTPEPMNTKMAEELLARICILRLYPRPSDESKLEE